MKTVAVWCGALSIGVLAVGFRLWLQPILGLDLHYGALLAAVVLTAAAFGMWPAVIVTVLGGFGLDLAVRKTLFPSDLDQLAGLLLFFAEGLIVTAVVESERRIQRRLRQSEARANELLAAYEKEIAERKKISNAERRHALWLEVTLSSIGDGLLVTDEAGIVTYMNGAAEKIIRVTRDNASGKSID